MAIVSGGTTVINNGAFIGVEGIPTGTIVPWTDSSLPTGFLECNGANVSRTTYADLFAVIGTTYGSGDGSSTFGLPDLQDEVVVGKSPTKALASTGGANTVSSGGSVTTNINVTGNVGGNTANATLSTPQLASHSHNTTTPRFGNPGEDVAGAIGQITTGDQAPQLPVSIANTGSGGGHSHNMSANFSGSGNASSNFSGNATSVVQPYLSLIYIIKT
jgi:microcystin-dependent protein